MSTTTEKVVPKIMLPNIFKRYRFTFTYRYFYFLFNALKIRFIVRQFYVKNFAKCYFLLQNLLSLPDFF